MSSRSYSIVAAVAPFVRLDQIVVGIFRLRILVQIHVGMRGACIAASHADLGERYLYCEGDIPLLSTENLDRLS